MLNIIYRILIHLNIDQKVFDYGKQHIVNISYTRLYCIVIIK